MQWRSCADGKEGHPNAALALVSTFPASRVVTDTGVARPGWSPDSLAGGGDVVTHAWTAPTSRSSSSTTHMAHSYCLCEL
jgi:hypothetical protein